MWILTEDGYYLDMDYLVGVGVGKKEKKQGGYSSQTSWYVKLDVLGLSGAVGCCVTKTSRHLAALCCQDMVALRAEEGSQGRESIHDNAQRALRTLRFTADAPASQQLNRQAPSSQVFNCKDYMTGMERKWYNVYQRIRKDQPERDKDLSWDDNKKLNDELEQLTAETIIKERDSDEQH